jgi:hypothetical protein
MKPTPKILCLLLCAFLAVEIYGKRDDDYWEIYNTTEKLNFDGICDEALWDNIEPIPLYMFRPNYSAEPTERSEIFITYDSDNLYVGARLFYENGGKIIATTKKRDGADGGCDNLGILLDSFNDNENALCFETNPTGLRSDFSLANDAQVFLDLLPFNRDWNTYWDVKTNIFDDSWHAELVIPLSSLRFQVQDGSVMMGMTIWRSVVSKQEWDVFPLVSNDFGTIGLWKPSQAQKVIFRNLERRNPLYITPYVLAGIEQESTLNNDHSGYVNDNTTKLNGGLDLKYALTSNITLDVTLNTDFAQVEVDDQMVNITRFDLFFPEKRLFFLERNSIFTVRTGIFDQLFYSRRIGLVEGEIIPIIAGARMVGRLGKYDLGFMDMQTLKHEYVDDDTDSLITVASTNHGVLRMRKQVFNETSYAGGMITSQVDVNGNYNINTSLDLIYNPFRNDFFTANYTQTFDNDHPVKSDFYNYGKLFLNWENRAIAGLSYQFLFSRAGANYKPDMGFELLEDYTRGFASLSYGWNYPQENIKILNQNLTFFTWINKQNIDFMTNISSFELNYALGLKSGYRFIIATRNNSEFLNEPLEINDDFIFPSGKYNYSQMDIFFRTPANKLFSLNGKTSLGKYYDGRLISVGPLELTYRPNSTLKLAVNYQYDQVDVPDRDAYFKSHLARLKTELTFTTQLSLLMFFQYSSMDHFGVNNVRFRYNPREGNDLYLVYNGGYNSDLKREIPHLPQMESNSWILKYTHTFIWEKK